MHLACGEAEALACDAGKEHRRLMSVEPGERPSQAVVVEHLRRDPVPQQVLQGLGREELRDQIQLAITEAQLVQDHRHCGRSDTHMLLAQPANASR